MKKLFGILLSAIIFMGVSITVKADYELTITDYFIVDKFAEKIDEIAEEKGDSFKVGIVALIRNLSHHEKATERVSAVFLVLADVVENGELPNNGGGTSGGGTSGGDLPAGTGTNETGTVSTGSIVTGGIVTGDFSLFENEGKLFTLVDFVDYFKEDISIFEPDTSKYRGLQYAKYNDFSVRIVSKDDLTIAENTLKDIFENHEIDSIKRSILPVEIFMNRGVLPEYLKLDYSIDNVKDSITLLSFEGQDGSDPVINIFLETGDYIIGIYNCGYLQDRETFQYLPEIAALIEGGRDFSGDADYVKYYQDALDTNETFSKLVSDTILEAIDVFTIKTTTISSSEMK